MVEDNGCRELMESSRAHVRKIIATNPIEISRLRVIHSGIIIVVFHAICLKPLDDNIHIWKRTSKPPLEIYLIYLDNREIYCIFKTRCIISVLFSNKIIFMS